MKKKLLAAIVAAVVLLAGCGEDADGPSSPVGLDELANTPSAETPGPTGEATPEPTEEPEETHEGMYRSELTNEWIDESLRNQRPIAVMVDNEITAFRNELEDGTVYGHYGLTQADVVYEMMNSLANGRVTRFMAIVKDWESLTQFGSIRSTRSTNIYLVGEWNAILCHDGGPFYATDLIAQKKYCDNLSGIFARVDNGKNWEYTEYIVQDDRSVRVGRNSQETRSVKESETVAGGIKARKYDREYNTYYLGEHFTFSDTEFDLSKEANSFTCTEIQIKPFEHNNSMLKYNETTGTYDYYEYNEAHLDPENGNAPLTFENLIIQKCTFSKLDDNGYFVYNCIGSGEGYYITNGTGIEITWEKASEQNDGTGVSLTVFRNKATGEEIVLNTGKTYIAIVPDDTWNKIVIK